MVGAGIGPGHHQIAAEMTERYGVEVTAEQVFNDTIPHEVRVAIAEERGLTPPAPPPPPAAQGTFDDNALEARLEEINPESNTWQWDSQFAASTPDAVIEALDAASSGNPQMDTFIQTLRDNPEMAQALQQALAQEGSHLLGQIENLVEGTNTEFSLESLNAALATEGGRNLFTHALELVAEDRIETRHLEGIMSRFHGANAHDGRFLAALDPSKEQLEAIINAGSQLTGSEAATNTVLAEIIAERTPQQFMTAVSAALGENELIDTIAADRELSEAIHAVVVAEPEALEGFQTILGSTGTNEFNVADLQNILNNPISRRALVDVLEVVAESDEFTFAHVTQLMEHHKNGDQEAMLALMSDMGITPGFGMEDFGEFFNEFMRDPEAAINNLVNMLVESGQIPAEMADTIRGFAVPMGNLMAGMIEPYHELAMRHDFSIAGMMDAAEQRGIDIRTRNGGPDVPDLTGGETITLPGIGDFPSNIFVAEVGDAELGTFDVTTIRANFTTALEGVDLTDQDAVTAALREALPASARDEFDGITSNTDLNGQFTAAMFGGAPDAAALAERAAEFATGMRAGVTHRAAGLGM